MGKRSLKASSLGIARAKQAFQRRDWTQEYLASAVGLQTRQPIWKFFSGRPIERHLFIDICFQLDLEWEDIAEFPKVDDLEFEQSTPSPLQQEVNLDWIQQVRSQVADTIQRHCSSTQNSLNLGSAPTLSQIYTEVYLLPHLSSQRWLEVEDLQSIESFNRHQNYDLTATANESVVCLQPHKVAIAEAIATHSRLMMVGKPGSGKTTALQHLALQCSEGQVQGDRIPVFVALRDWVAQPHSPSFDLEQYLSHLWTNCSVTLEQIRAALHEGKIWLLLDGLDEVQDDLQESLQRQIQHWVDAYPQLPIVITCRLAAQDYRFRGFTYMEVADFDPTQISTFVQKWFVAVNPAVPKIGSERAQQFLEQLQKRENQPLRELAVTPILLHLTCLVFQERGAFPKKRSRLYQHGLDILLVQWDAIRGIYRRSAHHPLSLPDRLNILSQLAAMMFERGRYFFEKTEVLAVIVEYLATLPNRSTDPETLWLESEAILQAIVLHHGLLVERAQGVYSFSHLTFQEYLTTRKFFTQSLAKPSNSASPYSLEALASHVANPRWQDVIALTIELLPDAQPLLTQMEQHTDALVADQPVLQNILQWTHRKASQIRSSHHPVAVRAFYLSLITTQSLDLPLAIDTSLTFDLSAELALDWELFQLLTMAQDLLHQPQFQRAMTLGFAFDLDQRFTLSQPLQHALQQLLTPLLEAIASSVTFQNWWAAQGQAWLEQLRCALIHHRDLGHQWHLNITQHHRLHQYYRTTLFLIHCLQETTQRQSSTAIRLEQVLQSSDPTLPKLLTPPLSS